MVTIGSMYSYLHYWAGLYGDEDCDRIKGGGDKVMRKATHLAPQSGCQGASPDGRAMLAITDGSNA